MVCFALFLIVVQVRVEDRTRKGRPYNPRTAAQVCDHYHLGCASPLAHANGNGCQHGTHGSHEGWYLLHGAVRTSVLHVLLLLWVLCCSMFVWRSVDGPHVVTRRGTDLGDHAMCHLHRLAAITQVPCPICRQGQPRAV